ncbi:hypothetical protein ACH4F6_21715 [Streptomyces sp. NPDC017936]|uniref:hypothetical protein n=1 Tax=Streptomyces sp. NPDC017936 TaxID=3365016 RepID=UPI0037A5E4B2
MSRVTELTTDPRTGETGPAQPVLFSEDYYRRIIKEFDYSPFDLRRFDFSLAGLGQEELNLRYLCHHAADRYVATPVDRRIVTTGFGMSGAPHMATASHIMKMVRLQAGGENCQIVLGDLDAYNGRGRSYGFTEDLAERFCVFSERLGFDAVRGVLRNQRDHAEALTNMYLLGRYTQESDFQGAEEDNHAYYASRGIVDETMTFRRRLSLALMASDFVTLGQTHEAVLVLLGVDEHKYVRFAQEVARRFDGDAPLRGDFALSALYARLNTGFNGHPKFSKSIPGSGISVETPAAEIRSLVENDESRDPAHSPVFQLMHQMTYCSHEELVRINQDCLENNSRWRAEKKNFAEYLVTVKEMWPSGE